MASAIAAAVRACAEHRRRQHREQDAGEGEQHIEAGGDRRVQGTRRQAAVTASSVPAVMQTRTTASGPSRAVKLCHQPGQHVAPLEVYPSR